MHLALFDSITRFIGDPRPPVSGRYEWAIGREFPTAAGYARQPISFGAAGSDGYQSSTGAVSFGPVPSMPAFPPPNDDPPMWIPRYAALCSAGVAGVSDVLASVFILDTGGFVGLINQQIMVAGETLSFAAGAVRYKSATAELTAAPTISPIRTTSYEISIVVAGVSYPNPAWNACYLVRLRSWLLAYEAWLATVRPADAIPDLDARLQKNWAQFIPYPVGGYASIAARAAAFGCP
jgi:hypothetical protein